MRTAFFALLLLAIPTSTLAQADRQTPANAHLFLRKLADEGRIRFEPTDNYTRYKTYRSHGNNGVYTIREESRTTPEDRYVLSLDTSSGCITKTMPVPTSTYAAHEQRPERTDGGGGAIPGDETWRPFVPHLRALAQNGIDWSRLSSAKAEGSAVILRGNALSGGVLTLTFESAEMATRAAFALEVIRQSCDPVGGTGF